MIPFISRGEKPMPLVIEHGFSPKIELTCINSFEQYDNTPCLRSFLHTL